MSHAHGLIHDLPHLLPRRKFLGFAGTSLLLAACDGGPFGNSEANVTGKTVDGALCLKTPVETNGPFPGDGSNAISGSTVNVLADEGIVRQDIRPSLRGLVALAEGARLELAIKLVDVTNACAPIPGFGIYVWHCDAAGKYSIYDLPDANYLRGVAFTDGAGVAPFTTIFPGAYPGRWPHIHFEVFNGWKPAATVKDSLLISQFALPEAACAALYADTPAYAASLAAFAGSKLSSDGIFAGNTPEQVASQTLAITGDPAAGYKAIVSVGLQRT